jgi:quinolinate synthase
MVHEQCSLEKITKLKIWQPDARIIALPECEESVLSITDFIESTTALLHHTVKDTSSTYIVATESCIFIKCKKSTPHKTFIPAPPTNHFSCNDCVYMKLNTLEKIYTCLLYEVPDIQLDETLLSAARKPIERMLEISNRLAL